MGITRDEYLQLLAQKVGKGTKRAGNGILRCNNFQRWEEKEEEKVKGRQH